MMRRNDFKAIADEIRPIKIKGDFSEKVFCDFIDKLCIYFKKSNSSFDKERFMRASGFYNNE